MKKKQKIKYQIALGIISLIAILALGFMSSALRKSAQQSKEIQQQQEEISNQKSRIKALSNTKEVRNYNGVKNETDKALKGAMNALYTYKGKEYADRYEKAEKYMTQDVVAGVTTNGQVPDKKDMKQAGKNMAAVGMVSKVTEIENGIQNINGLNVTGFTWVTVQSKEFNKGNSVLTFQVKYTYDLSAHKFTEFKTEPFSCTVVD